jgi:hypothetical protein
VGGVYVAVQKRYRHRLGAGFDQFHGELGDVGLIQRGGNRAVGVHALGYVKAQPTGHQRLWQLDHQVIQIEPMLVRDLQHISKPGGREYCAAGTLAFDQGVGDQGGAVYEALDLGCVCAAAGEHLGNHLFDGLGRFIGRREHLADSDDAGVIHQAQVGKCAADIHPDPQLADPYLPDRHVRAPSFIGATTGKARTTPPGGRGAVSTVPSTLLTGEPRRGPSEPKWSAAA